MKLFSISQLQQFSGIKAHTIRVWEQRYNGLSPIRSEGNTRYYDNEQLRRLLNIVSLLECGYKISELCAMTDRMHASILEKQFKETEIKEGTNEYFVSQLIAASIAFDELYFEKVFSGCILRLGMKNTYTKVIYPMLSRVGLMWAAESVTPECEHFCSNLIKQKLFSAIDSLPPVQSKECWLLFLPEDEFHEIGLLFAYYLIRHSGKKVVYLGGNVPFNTLLNTIERISPDHLLFFLVHQDMPENAQGYLNMLKKNPCNARIHLSGNEKLISQLKTGKDVNWIHSVEELEKQLV